LSKGGSQSIAVPKGGGALQGIGEKFSPDVQTGTGNFRVPIALPQGRNGFGPQLSLVYSSGSGNGPYGLGFALDVPGVARKSSTGVPRYSEGDDTFILSGAEDLVATGGAPPGAQRYLPRTEGLFARIDHLRDGNYWRVATKDGLLSVYGTAPGGSGVASLSDPADAARVFAWRLSRSTDLFGNIIEYRYEPDIAREGGRSFTQLYLSSVRYADFGDRAAPGFLVEARFAYELRPDPFSDCRPGFEVRTRKRCTRIEVVTHAGIERAVRTYHFDYLDQLDVPRSRQPLNGVSLLARVRVEGHDGATSQWLPPIELGYTGFDPRARKLQRLGGDLPEASLSPLEHDLADLFGTGLPDFLQLDGTRARYWRNLGNGRFDLPRDLKDAPAGLSLADPGVQLVDADGDGRIDLMVSGERGSGYFPLRAEGSGDRSFRRYRAAPSFDLKDPEVKLVDLDGDGVPDAIRSGTRLECFFNDPDRGWIGARQLERRGLDVFPNVSFSDPRVRFADMTGDGLSDLVLIHNGRIDYWPSRGRGDFGARVHMQGAPHLPDSYDPRRILLGDVDGDGLADLVYVGDGEVTLFINQCGNGFGPPIVLRGTPRVADAGGLRLADLLGTGVPGVLFSAEATAGGPATFYFLDLIGGNKPYLLDRIDNHSGAVTRIEYAASTRYALADAAKGKRWKTSLPFAVQVVAKVETVDAISGGRLVTEYDYHHGHWDGTEREFRGFGRVDQRDAEQLEASPIVAARSPSPPLETRSWFELGPVGERGAWDTIDLRAEYWVHDQPAFPSPPALQSLLRDGALPGRSKRAALRSLRGRTLRTELYALDGTALAQSPYAVTEQLHDVREVPGAPGAERVYFPHALAERTTRWERGDEPMTRLRGTSFDELGLPVQVIDVAVPRGRDYRSAGPASLPYLATASITDRARSLDPARYLMDRVSRVTSQELTNDGSAPALRLLFDLDGAVRDGLVARQLLGQQLHYYDGGAGAAFVGLPFGQLGAYGAAVRTETLVLTDAILADAYRSGDTIRSPPELPPYLAPAGAAWPDEYPQEFRDRLKPSAGYLYRPASATSAAGYFAVTAQRRFDFHGSTDGTGRGLLKGERDPLGVESSVDHDAYDLFPIAVSQGGLIERANHDYRALQPFEVTDTNGNITRYSYTPLGLTASVALLGHPGGAEGDTPDVPGVTHRYDFAAWDRERKPNSIHTSRRVHHAADPSVPPAARSDALEAREYSDGFGRVLQSRALAEDVVFPSGAGLALDTIAQQDAVGVAAPAVGGPRVRVTGWQIYDDKGRPIVRHEPFFSAGWDYAPPADAERGEKVVFYYGPLGAVVRTVNPDGSELRVIYGKPTDVSSPDRYRPTPWEAYTYDANDNAGRTHAASSAGYQSHWNTPSSVVLDALGRVTVAIERKGPAASDAVATRSLLDIRGNVLSVIDSLGRIAAQTVYDLAENPQPLRVQQLDGAVRRTVLDAAGGPVEQRDGRSALTLHGYDPLRRRVRLWARDGSQGALTLRERLLYGDAADSGLTDAQAAAGNLRGRLYRHYDEAGRAAFEAYDLHGNVRERTRQVIADGALLAPFVAPPADWTIRAFVVDWQPPAGKTLADLESALLDPSIYRTSLAYDALGRVTSVQAPADVSGARKQLVPQYNAAGLLDSLWLDGTAYLQRVAYDAKGQRILVALGNGLMTRHAYDPKTFRLARQRTEPFVNPSPLIFRAAGKVLQDVLCSHDLSGNLLAASERAEGSGLAGTPDQLDRAFSYDPLYRLIAATGREADVPAGLPWEDAQGSQDPTATRAYDESYRYDDVGNLLELRHQAGPTQWTRVLSLASGNNQLAAITAGGSAFDYSYDGNGNLSRETSSRHQEWDQADRLRVHRTQAAAAEPSIHAQYLHDAAGRRVKKLVRKQGGRVETTAYIDELFEHRRVTGSAAAVENDTLCLMDGARRVAQVRIGPPADGEGTPAVQYTICDQLGSCTLAIDDAGSWISREEYLPYGGTSFGGYARKRYRFTGKERDDESGLYYYGARYYLPWAARFASCDPAGMKDGPNPYPYARCNPLRFTDPTGTESVPACTGTSQDEQKEAAFQNPASMARNANRSLFQARGTSDPAGLKAGMPLENLEGPLKLWSGDPGKAAALAEPGGYIMRQTTYEMQADEIARSIGYSGKRDPALYIKGTTPPEDFLAVWKGTSESVARDAALRGDTVQHYGLDSHPNPGETVQYKYEMPAVSKWGAFTGTLMGFSGTIGLISALETPNRFVKSTVALTATFEIFAGVKYALGSALHVPALQTLGMGAARFAGGAGGGILAAYSLFTDVERRDWASAVGSATMVLSSIAILLGFVTVGWLLALGALSYGVTRWLMKQPLAPRSERSRETVGHFF
jgi:RHS repeat-associated protein